MENVTFSQLKKDAKRDMTGLPALRFALLGDCATRHLATALVGAAYRRGYRMIMYNADYDLIDAHVMDGGSAFYAHKPAIVLIALCTEKLYDAFCNRPQEARCRFAEDMMRDIARRWDLIAENGGMRILQFLFMPGRDEAFGAYGAKTPSSFIFQARRLNMLIMERASERADVLPMDLSCIAMEMGLSAFRDAALYYAANMPFSVHALPAIASHVMDTVCALNGRVMKCAVLDLDNTLWGGVIGDDGVEGIEIGELGRGQAFRAFQRWFRELRMRGVLLAVCSKNDEETAREPFEKHPDMVLRMDDFAMFVANWQDKAANIRHIRQTLNIGMDSMVFFDDNPFERELVRSLIPDIIVPELPEDPAQYLDHCRRLNLFATASFSPEDAGRTAQYQLEARRTSLRQAFASYDEYLRCLDMQSGIAAFDSFHFGRIAQLTQRSNQFNLRTVRYTEEQIAALARDTQHLTLYFTLRDRLGDHGLVSVVILDKQPGGVAFISEWIMSCRVLKRGMEEFVMARVMETARKAGFDRVVGEYLPTPKNAMVADVYDRMGFAPLGGGRYEARTASWRPLPCHIRPETE